MAKSPKEPKPNEGPDKWDFIGPPEVRSIANEIAQLSLRLTRVAEGMESRGQEIRPLQGNLWRAIEALDFIITKEFEAKSRRKFRDIDKK